MTEKELVRLMSISLAGKWTCFPECKDGPTWGRHDMLRMDIVAIKKSYTNPCIRIYEAKANRSGFTGDDKWPGYMQLCNEFYWLCPKGLIKKDEVHENAGIVYVYPTGTIRTYKRAKYEIREPDPDMLMYLIVSRLDKMDGYPTKTTADKIREELREDRELGKTYNQFVSKKLSDANDFIRDAERKITTAESKVERINEMCVKYGIGDWQIPNILETYHNIQICSYLKKQLTQARDSLDGILNALEKTHEPNNN